MQNPYPLRRIGSHFVSGACEKGEKRLSLSSDKLLTTMEKTNIEKKTEALARVLEVMDTLRRECPWDRKQTFDTLRNKLLWGVSKR